jgi:hypothetical protein
MVPAWEATLRHFYPRTAGIVALNLHWALESPALLVPTDMDYF